MSASEEINAKLDWCVDALKYLLKQAKVDDEDEWLDEEDTGDVLVPVHEPRPKVKPCPHNQQMLVNGRIMCVRPNEEGVVCGEILGTSGVRGKDPHSPVPAPGHEESLNHVSSQNPRY